MTTPDPQQPYSDPYSTSGYPPAAYPSGSYPTAFPAGPDPTAAYPAAAYPPAYPAPAGYPAPGGYPAPVDYPTSAGYPAQVGYPQPAYGQPYPGYPVAPRNGMGTAALVVGIIAVVMCWNFIGVVLGILAIIFGGVGLGRAKQGVATNRSMAMTGLILGIVALALLVIFIVAFVGAVGFGLSTV